MFNARYYCLFVCFLFFTRYDPFSTLLKEKTLRTQFKMHTIFLLPPKRQFLQFTKQCDGYFVLTAPRHYQRFHFLLAMQSAGEGGEGAQRQAEVAPGLGGIQQAGAGAVGACRLFSASGSCGGSLHAGTE